VVDKQLKERTELTHSKIGAPQRESILAAGLALQQAGVIRYSRGQIEITDLRALEATACECHSTVKAHYARLLARRP